MSDNTKRDSSSSAPRLSGDQDAEIIEYRALSPPAMVGLIVGLLSPLALIAPLLWAAPILGIVLSTLGLLQIAHNPTERAGRKAALIGLGLSLFVLLFAVANYHVYRQLVRKEARHFSEQWFAFLAAGEPHKALQMIRDPKLREPLDDQLWDFYRVSPLWEDELREYVEEPLVRLLLELGEKAQARYWGRDKSRERFEAEQDMVYPIYAVTYDNAAEKKTFFVALKLKRIRTEDGQSNWFLIKNHHSFVPEGFEL